MKTSLQSSSGVVSAVSETQSTQVSQVSENVGKNEKSSKTESSDKSGMKAAEKMKMFINGEPVNVDWENNQAVDALRNMAEKGDVIIQMSMYGGFEQVGSIGQSLPRNDKQTTTSSGDIVLYSGNQMVVFYGSNSWSYTRLGHISDKDEAGMTELLSNGDVTITISMG